MTLYLDDHPNVHLLFTPIYSFWLNQVELWFSKFERDVIARGVFTSVPDLKRKLMRYIRQYNKAPRTVNGSTLIRHDELLPIQLLQSASKLLFPAGGRTPERMIKG